MRFLLLSFVLLFAAGAKAQQQPQVQVQRLNAADTLQPAPAFRFTPGADILPKNYATKDFGFFCRQELKLEKKTGIPLRLRLGSMEECNRIEGKQR